VKCPPLLQAFGIGEDAAVRALFLGKQREEEVVPLFETLAFSKKEKKLYSVMGSLNTLKNKFDRFFHTMELGQLVEMAIHQLVICSSRACARV
jgi:hypothetical protein